MSGTRSISDFYRFGKKIIGVGRNFAEHAKELGNKVPKEPFVFLKPTTAYISQGQNIILPKTSPEIHHEVELGVVIGKGGSAISESSAMNHVGGYVLALDMTDRIEQQKAKEENLPWALSKGFDTSCPVSDFIPKEKIHDPQNVDLWLKVNGDMKQQGSTKDMVFPVSRLISWISEHFTLEEGDLILTGTPQGVSPVKDGDIIECGLGGFVSMKFDVVAYK